MTHVGSPYKQQALEERYDAIVIGSGMGGLSAAALLAKHAEMKVLVLERHYTAGGFTHVFRRPGYEWDVGVHYIGRVTSPDSELRAAFDHLTEGRLQWNPMPDIYDRVRIAERTYDFPSGRERFRDRMKRYFPREANAVDAYLVALDTAGASMGAYFAEKALPAALARLAGPLLRSRYLSQANRITADVLRGFTRDPELIAVLTGQWPDYGLPPGESSFAMHAGVAHHYLEGAAYPVGGASEIAAGIAPVIEGAGGRIVVAAEVAGILLEGNGRATGVRMSDGREIHSDIRRSQPAIRGAPRSKSSRRYHTRCSNAGPTQRGSAAAPNTMRSSKRWRRGCSPNSSGTYPRYAGESIIANSRRRSRRARSRTTSKARFTASRRCRRASAPARSARARAFVSSI